MKYILKNNYIFSILSLLIISCYQPYINDNNGNSNKDFFYLTPYTDIGSNEVKIDSIINFYSSRDSADIYYFATYNLSIDPTDDWEKESSYTFDRTGDIKIVIKDIKNEIESNELIRIYSVIPENKLYKPASIIQMNLIHKDATIDFTSKNSDDDIYVGYNTDTNASEPLDWTKSDKIKLDTSGEIKVFAKSIKTGSINSEYYTRIYNVVDKYPSIAGSPDSDAVHMDDASIISWASGYTDYIPGTNCDAEWQNPINSLDKASGTSYDVVSLGRSGEITLIFNNRISNDTGFDFAVFENGFSDTFLEIAFVEVSSNGNDFVRFDNVSLSNSPIGELDPVDTEKIYGLAGKYIQGYGTPFDLSELTEKEDVIKGKIDLQNIKYIRIIDIVGDGNINDSFGNPIYDIYPTYGSAGFDLDAIGVLN